MNTSRTKDEHCALAVTPRAASLLYRRLLLAIHHRPELIILYYTTSRELARIKQGQYLVHNKAGNSGGTDILARVTTFLIDGIMSSKPDNSKVREISVRNDDDNNNIKNSSPSDLFLSAMLEETSQRVAGKRAKDVVLQQQQQQQLRNGCSSRNNQPPPHGASSEQTTNSSNNAAADKAAAKRPLQVTLDQCVSEETTDPLHSATSSRQNLLPRRGAASSEVRFHCHECRMSFVSHCFVIVSHPSLMHVCFLLLIRMNALSIGR